MESGRRRHPAVHLPDRHACREAGTGGGDDEEVLLLRVEGTCQLSLERDLQAVREEALRDALSQKEDLADGHPGLEIDLFTKKRISFTGLECRDPRHVL